MDKTARSGEPAFGFSETVEMRRRGCSVNGACGGSVRSIRAHGGACTRPDLSDLRGAGGNHAIYHATAMVWDGGDTIYIDPAYPANISGLQAGDLILITHTHPDHFYPAYIEKLSNAQTKVIGPAAAQKTLKTIQVIANGQSIHWHQWKITAVAMYNTHHLMPNGQPYHPKGAGNGYVLSYGGKNFYFAGDTEETTEMHALQNIDVAFIPMNLPYTMSLEEAAAAVETFKPKIAIPYHYRGQDPQRFADALRGSGIEVRLLNWYSNIAPGARPMQPPARKAP